MTGTTDEDEETRELFQLRDRLEEYRREVERRDEYLRGADVDIKEARAEVERLRNESDGFEDTAAALSGELRDAYSAIEAFRTQVATLTAERDRLKASNEGIAASLEAQVEAARKDERAACLDLAVDAMSPFTGTDNDAHNEACRRIIDAIKRRGAR